MLLPLCSPMILRMVRPEHRRRGACPGTVDVLRMEPTVALNADGLIRVCHQPVSAAQLGCAPGALGHTERGLKILSNASNGFLRPNAPPTGSPRLATAPIPGVTAPKLHLPDLSGFLPMDKR